MYERFYGLRKAPFLGHAVGRWPGDVREGRRQSISNRTPTSEGTALSLVGGCVRPGETEMKPARRRHVLGMAAVLHTLAPFVLLGCGSTQAFVAPVGGPVGPTQAPAEYRIQPGDQLDIKFFYNPELNEAALVRSDGKISLQLIDDIQAAGLTPAQLDQDLTRLYAQELQRPTITVLVRASTGHRIYVGGEVGTPGLLTLAPGTTALQAVINAGGFRETAKPGAVIVIRKGSDNRAIPIRVDLDPSLDGVSAEGDISLEPSDIVYVPRTFIAEANLFVNQYIERLLLYRGISLGFGYDLRGPTR